MSARVVFRKLDYKSSWRLERAPEEDWLLEDDLRGDVLKDLRTVNNSLSVYVLTSPNEEALQRIAVACAANRDKLVELDFVLIDFEVVGDLGISHREVAGDTPDEEVNKWHWDLCQLTVKKLVALARAIREGGTFTRLQQKHVGRLLNRAISEGILDRSRLNPDVVHKLSDPRFSGD